MTPAGVFTEYKAGPEYPREITSSTDGDLWYTSWWNGNSHVTKMTTAGVISTEYALQPNSDPAGITVGPNKHMWIAAGSEVATIEP
jgi:streptogramin lyase